MALRSLLRQIPCPVRLSQSGPLMGPVHGISPTAASRFMGTRSQGRTRTVAELQEIINLGSAKIQQSFDEFDRLHEEVAVNRKALRLKMDEKRGAVEELKKLNVVAFAVMAAMSGLLIFCKNYQA